MRLCYNIEDVRFDVVTLREALFCTYRLVLDVENLLSLTNFHVQRENYFVFQ